MSTLAELTPNIDEFKSAVYRTLQADATLQGSTYLDRTNGIVAQEKAPKSVVDGGDARLHIIFEIAPLDMYTATADVLARLMVVLRNPQRGIPGDRARLGRILERIGEVVVGHGVFTASGYEFFDSWVEGFTDVGIDTDAPEESHQSIMIPFRARKL